MSITKAIATKRAKAMLKINVQARWTGCDSIIWVLPKHPDRVIKVTRLNVAALRAHRRMVVLGDAFPYVARVYDVRPIGFAEYSSKSDPWLYCIVIQRLINDDHKRCYERPPLIWNVKGDEYIQEDGHEDNYVAGVWVDVARIRRKSVK